MPRRCPCQKDLRNHAKAETSGRKAPAAGKVQAHGKAEASGRSKGTKVASVPETGRSQREVSAPGCSEEGSSEEVSCGTIDDQADLRKVGGGEGGHKRPKGSLWCGA